MVDSALRRGPRRRARTGILAGALAAGLLGVAAGAEEARPAPEAAPRDAAATESQEGKPELVPVEGSRGRSVGLDDLLRLPDGFSADVERRGGSTRLEWRARFDAARQELTDAQQKLVAMNEELDQLSGTSAGWQVAAPGSSDPQTSPLSLRLRQDIKDQRVRIEEAERKLRSLDVEADLAAVPVEWRGEPGPEPGPDEPNGEQGVD